MVRGWLSAGSPTSRQCGKSPSTWRMSGRRKDTIINTTSANGCDLCSIFESGGHETSGFVIPTTTSEASGSWITNHEFCSTAQELLDANHTISTWGI